MIRFRCHRCKRPLAVPDKKFVGKKVKCPGCSITTIVPDIPGAQEAKARIQAKVAAEPETEYVDAAQVIDDPLAALAGVAEGYAVEEESPRSRREPDRPRRIVKRKPKGAGAFMFFGALLVLAGGVGALVTHIKELEDAALFFSLSGAGAFIGLVLFFTGVSRA